MSLLNEALRKNRAQGQPGTQPLFTNGKAMNFKRLFIIAAVAVVAAAAVFAALKWGRNSGIQDSPSMLETLPREASPGMTSVTSVPETTQAANTGVIKDGSAGNTQNSPVQAPVKSAGASPPAVAPKNNINRNGDDKKKSVQEKNNPIEEAVEADMDRFFQKALQLHRDGSIQDAIIIYRDILKHAPDHYDAVCNLSSAYIELSDFSSAFNLLTGYPESGSPDARLLLNLAIAETGMGRHSAAIDHLNKIDGADEDLNFRKHFHLGVAEGRMGRAEEALAHYKEAEEISNNHPGLLYNIAILYDRLSRYDEAVDYYYRYMAAGISKPDEAAAVKSRIQTLKAYISGSGTGSAR